MVHPLGHEYIRNHRAFRILADRLAFQGFTVLRFDFLGTGDSWGDLEDVGFADWVEDLQMARAALAAEIGDGPVCLIGRRLGAALALLADAESGSCAGTGARAASGGGTGQSTSSGLGLTRSVLWDPVLEGEPYLRGIEGVHRDYHQVQAHRGNVAEVEGAGIRQAEGASEVLGMVLPPALVAEIEALNVQQAYAACGPGTLILDSHPSGSLLQEPAAATLRRAQDSWQSDDPLSIFVPMHILQMIASWVAEG